jgi:molecular chaperone DnaK (HSP70)
MNFIIGIDLRTTNSYVGVLRNNENTIKRLIGGNYSDELVQEDIK